MQKEQRKLLLEKMLIANEKMSMSSPQHLYDYVQYFMQLCDEREYKHASAILSYEKAKESADYTNDQYCEYILNLEAPDAISENLKLLMDHHEELLESHFESNDQAIKYFLEQREELNSLVDMKV